MGGGISVNGSRVTVTNSLIYGNSTRGILGGGGICVYQSGANLTLVNSTVSGNESFYLSANNIGAVSVVSATATILNSIIWQNVPKQLTGPFATFHIEYSDIGEGQAGPGNLVVDPQFVRPWDGLTANLRLACESPCLDAGTSGGAPFTDIEGNPRPAGAGVDMGAYEGCVLVPSAVEDWALYR
jgi:hypothetical protein